ncbi:MAG: restriction endonuclease subunit S [Akkermansiaceae bacterium]|nr:restriction endonuclease subunit S [Akkermansiaceae bacterium]
MKTKSRKVRLKDVCDRITVGHVGSMKDEYVAEGISFLRSQNIHPFRLNLADIKFVTPEFHAKLKKSALKPGDVAVVRTGYPGTACVIPKSLPVSNCSDLVIISPNETELDSGYLAAVFNSSWGVATVGGNLVGAAQQHFNVGAAKEMEINLPDLPTQRKIAGILSAYDDLIENNLRRIKILEELAQSLYREWFVHFRFPGHESARFIDSSLGRMPKGWEVRKILDFADVIYGFSFKANRFNTAGEGIPVVRIRNIQDGQSETYTEEEGDPKHRIKNGDILVGMDGDFHMTIWSGGDAWQNQRVAKFRPKGAMGNYLLFLTLEKPIHYFDSTITGTTVAHLGDSHIKTIEFASPPESLMREASDLFEPMAQEQLNLRRRNQTLRRTRDLLLPKLLKIL